MIRHEHKGVYLHFPKNGLQIKFIGKCFPREGQLARKMLAIIAARTDVIRKMRGVNTKGPGHAAGVQFWCRAPFGSEAALRYGGMLFLGRPTILSREMSSGT